MENKDKNEKLEQERLEELIEEKVDEKTENIQKENKELRKEIEKLKTNSNKFNKDSRPKRQGMSRRQFLKKAGLGTAGLAALMSPVSSLDVRDDGFSVFTQDSGSDLTFEVDGNGNVEITNGDLHMNNNNISNVGEINGSDADEIGEGGVPSGVITMWSGDETDVPDGWTLCDGNNGTPDLQDRFIIGAGNQYNVDETGGAESVSLSTSQLPSHDHGDGSLSVSSHSHGSGSLSTSTDGEHNHAVAEYRDTDKTGGFDYIQTAADGEYGPRISYTGDIFGTQFISDEGSHNHDVSGSTSSSSPGVSGSTGNTGGGDAHENRPPYYALAFIMKL